ncbi:MAG: metal-binding protein [Taibaiella sp.]|nr:metal-binding protein [Taibaiella sp.]
MILHSDITDKELATRFRNRAVLLGGNRCLNIYGRLNCKSGKRMKKGNRVFFASVQEAVDNGFRPCRHCMANNYKLWKDGLI